MDENIRPTEHPETMARRLWPALPLREQKIARHTIRERDAQWETIMAEQRAFAVATHAVSCVDVAEALKRVASPELIARFEEALQAIGSRPIADRLAAAARL